MNIRVTTNTVQPNLRVPHAGRRGARWAFLATAVCLAALVQVATPARADTLRNPAACGLKPWQRSLRDVNLVNGNLFKSFTDIQVAPARGAGLVLQRTYNSNDDREGPFGVGWTHAYDIRTEDVGDGLMERTDFFGGKHGYVREADGLYVPPLYKRSVAAALATDPQTGDVTADEEEDKDGTVKRFETKGGWRCCTSIRDRHGNTTELSYDGGGLLQTVTDPSDRVLTFTWTNVGTSQDVHWRITAVTASDSSGVFQRVDYGYYDGSDPNSAYSLHTVTLHPDGNTQNDRTTTFDYVSYTSGGLTETHLLSKITDPLGQYVSYIYGHHAGWDQPGDPLFDVVQIDEPGSPDAVRHPAANGRHVWIHEEDSQWPLLIGELWTSNDGLHLKTSRPWYQPDALAVISDAPNTQYSSGNFLQLIQYNTDMSVASTARIANYFWFEEPGTQWTEQNYTYWPNGSPHTSWVTGFEDAVTTQEYYGTHKYFQQRRSVDPNGLEVFYDYFEDTEANPGNRGNLLSVTVDPGDAPHLNQTTSFTYNQYGQKETETNPEGVVRKFSYEDDWGNLTKVVQDWSENPTGHLMRTVEMEYDAAGRVTQVTDPAGQVIETDYNALGQLLTVQYPATLNTPAETISYTYGQNGRTETVAAGNRVTAFGYETLNGQPLSDRIVSVTESVNQTVVSTIGYTYGLAGEILQRQLPNGQIWDYRYESVPGYPAWVMVAMPDDQPDSLMPRLASITDNSTPPRQVSYRFNGLGALVWARSNEQFTSPPESRPVSRLATTYEIDRDATLSPYYYSHGWVQQVKNSWETYDWDENPLQWVWNSSPLTQNDYTYDDVGNKLTNAITLASSSRTEAYGYDRLYRLTGVDYEFTGGTPVFDDAWWYDPAGNRQSAGNHSYNVYNAANMLLQSGTNYYTNDLNGNTLSGGGRTNVWDSQNRLAETVFNNVTSAFTYGPDGLRRTATAGGVTTQYILDGQNVVQEVTTDPVGTEIVSYLWGPRGPEARIDPAGNALWFLYDGHGNVLGEVNSQGVINPDMNGDPTVTRDFDPWGFVLNYQQVANNGNNLKYCGSLGHPSETDTGLIYMRARYYDPVLGRFISEDPAGEGKNWFAYAGNDPVGMSDFTGLTAGTLGDVAGGAGWGAALAGTAGSGAAFIGGLMVYKLLGAVGLREADLDLTISIVFSNTSQNKQVDDVASDLGLTNPERKQLGNEIHKRKRGSPEKVLDIDEIYDIAKRVLDQRGKWKTSK